jgi:acetylornithine deacetylase
MVRSRVEDILADLVGFATCTRTANDRLLHYVSDFLATHGVASKFFWTESGDRGNLLATIGPVDQRGGVVLSGHTDVVPVDAAQWNTDPFVATTRDGRMYGRGTADMKGFIASVLAAIPALVSRPLARPVHLVFTYDEEIDCAGMRDFLSTSEAGTLRPQAVILGEPTDMSLVIGHRGHSHLETTIRGRQSHGGNAWQGASAIAVAGKLISDLYAHHPGIQGANPAEASKSTSVNIGTIRGGDQFNIVAGLCRFDWEVRPALGVDGNAILEEFKQKCREIEAFHAARGAQIAIETVLLESYAEYRSDPDSPAVALVRSLTGLNDVSVVGYGTEAPFYQEYGMPVVVFGPGSINQAHQPNEYVEISQLRSCTDFIEALARHLAA